MKAGPSSSNDNLTAADRRYFERICVDDMAGVKVTGEGYGPIIDTRPKKTPKATK